MQLYLIGTINSNASLPSANANSYTNNNCYIGEDNCLYSNGKKVSTEEQVEILYEKLNPVFITEDEINNLSSLLV